MKSKAYLCELQPPPELRSGGGHLGQQDIPAGQAAPSPENERSEFRGRAGEGVNGLRFPIISSKFITGFLARPQAGFTRRRFVARSFSSGG